MEVQAKYEGKNPDPKHCDGSRRVRPRLRPVYVPVLEFVLPEILFPKEIAGSSAKIYFSF